LLLGALLAPELPDEAQAASAPSTAMRTSA
jgi:hypothetical protein